MYKEGCVEVICMHYCGDDIGKFDDVLAIIRGATEPDADFGLADTAASSFILVLDRLLEKFEGPTTSLLSLYQWPTRSGCFVMLPFLYL
jgi:hypothetical protein